MSTSDSDKVVQLPGTTRRKRTDCPIDPDPIELCKVSRGQMEAVMAYMRIVDATVAVQLLDEAQMQSLLTKIGQRFGSAKEIETAIGFALNMWVAENEEESDDDKPA